MRRLVPLLLLLTELSTHAAELTIPPAIKSPFRFGLLSGIAIDLDAAGNIYVAGSSDRLKHAASTILGPGGGEDVFVMKVSVTDRQVLYITEIGGSAIDRIAAIAVDRSGNVFLAGNTTSSDFPTTAGSFQVVGS